ncbi:hypothetical protein CAPTEDRAFT_213109 [Capitella teleta]|uniref:Uncharacterized protein n=1 Tax=Capitella teleta TaxID=283909 RepID=R7VIG0_CAPTE|nr:hypothetical protein CAPTEDRAFT_213109 [Capitella teleta]|eukprot:ELU18404.1 hypothetical protein CAPTEDRAFT_213109 [Capitella teleta]
MAITMLKKGSLWMHCLRSVVVGQDGCISKDPHKRKPAGNERMFKMSDNMLTSTQSGLEVKHLPGTGGRERVAKVQLQSAFTVFLKALIEVAVTALDSYSILLLTFVRRKIYNCSDESAVLLVTHFIIADGDSLGPPTLDLATSICHSLNGIEKYPVVLPSGTNGLKSSKPTSSSEWCHSHAVKGGLQIFHGQQVTWNEFSAFVAVEGKSQKFGGQNQT